MKWGKWSGEKRGMNRMNEGDGMDGVDGVMGKEGISCSARPASRRWTATRTVSLTREKCCRIFPYWKGLFCLCGLIGGAVVLCLSVGGGFRGRSAAYRVRSSRRNDSGGCAGQGFRKVSLAASSAVSESEGGAGFSAVPGGFSAVVREDSGFPADCGARNSGSSLLCLAGSCRPSERGWSGRGAGSAVPASHASFGIRRRGSELQFSLISK